MAGSRENSIFYMAVNHPGEILPEFRQEVTSYLLNPSASGAKGTTPTSTIYQSQPTADQVEKLTPFVQQYRQQKMIFGLFGSKGKMEVQLKQFNFHPGETIEGMIILQVMEKVNAKGVSIQFRGIMDTTTGPVNNRRSNTVVLIDIT